MCGRYSHRLTWPEIIVLYRITNVVPPNPFGPRYNQAPTDPAPVIWRDRDGARLGGMMRWGLIPYWAKDAKISYSTINARAETIATAPTFREPFERRRCLVPASAFYEWLKGAGKTKQPFAIALADGSPMTFAGLWDSWRDRASGERVQSFTIITGPPNALTGILHDRMPVILAAEDWPHWLGEQHATPEELLALLRPYPAEAMTAWPADARVGNVKNDDQGLLEPIGPKLAMPA